MKAPAEVKWVWWLTSLAICFIVTGLVSTST